MPFTLSAPFTIAGVANSYEVTGSGNLDELVTACSGIGMSRKDKEIVYNPATANILAISGTLTETRTGIYSVRIDKGHICWAYAAGSAITLGAKNAAGAYPSEVNILYSTTALATGVDPYQSQPGLCAVGNGAFTHVSGSLIYSQSGRSDMNFYSIGSPGAINLDNVTYCQTTASVSFMMLGSGRLSTTAKTAILSSPRPHHYLSGSAAPITIRAVFTDAGVRMLGQYGGQVTRIEQPLNSNVDAYLSADPTSRCDVIDPITQYSPPVGGGNYLTYPGIKRVLRTLRAKFTDNLGNTITNATPKLITVTSTGTVTTSNFVGTDATSEVLQSTRASGVNHDANGLGYTNEGNYSFYAVGFGYASNFTSVNVRTANSGNAGIPWNPTATKSPLVTSAYASVVTAPFSFSTTGTGTLTISANATVAQAAEHLFKLAYDNADVAFWRGIGHTPATFDGVTVNFGAINIVVAVGATLTGTAFKTSGTITNNGTITPTYTDGAGTRVNITERTGKLLSTYVTVNGTPVGGTVVDGTFRAGWVPLSASRTITVQPTDQVRISASFYGSKPSLFNLLGSEIDKFTLSLDQEPAVDTTVATATRDAIAASFATVVNGQTIEVTINRTLAQYTPTEVIVGLAYYLTSKGYIIAGAIAQGNNASLYAITTGTIISYSPNYKIRMADLDANSQPLLPSTDGYEVPLVIYYQDPQTGTKGKMTLLNVHGAFIGTAPWPQSQASVGDADQTAIATKAKLQIEASTIVAKEATVASRLAASAYTAPDNAGVASIKAKTDTLTNGPTAADIKAAIEAAGGKLDKAMKAAQAAEDNTA